MVRLRPVLSAVLGTVAGILILASGCTEQGPTAIQLQPATALSAAKAYQNGSFTVRVGPSGAVFGFPIGQVTFPSGAVSQETTITATLDGRTLAIDFQPHIIFPAEARPTLRISVAGLGVSSDRLQFAHISDEGTVSWFRPVIADGYASVNVEGFSRWILAAD